MSEPLGMVSFREFSEWMKKSNPYITDEEIEMQFAEMDHDNDDAIFYEDYEKYIHEKQAAFHAMLGGIGAGLFTALVMSGVAYKMKKNKDGALMGPKTADP